MELEFDKEINAILRIARDGVGAGVTAIAGEHLDADTIAAFAENALPETARLTYTRHFADCNRCRTILSRSIVLNSEADVAAASVPAPVAEPVIPWYQKLLRTPNLALAMGALVLTFGGILGFLALQNGQTRNSEVSRAIEPASKKDGPYLSGESEAANSAASNTISNSNAVASSSNTAVPASNISAANPSGLPGGPSDRPAGILGEDDSAEKKPEAVADKSGAVGGAATEPAKAAPAPAPSVEQPKDLLAKTEIDKKENKLDESASGTRDADMAKRKQAEERGRMDRESPPPASKAGPSRSGPLQNQTQINNNTFEMPVTRIVGGKTFHNRDGAWYDSAYHGQGTTNVSRGTDAYRKLDGGLRKIADTIGGTVVVVWKEKAYRIQ